MTAPSWNLRGPIAIACAAALCSAPVAAQHEHAHPAPAKPATPAPVRRTPPTPSNQVKVEFSIAPVGVQRGGGAAGALPGAAAGRARPQPRIQLHGHIWEELPNLPGSRRLGSNPFSEWKGAQNGHGPSNHFDVLLKNGAGGAFGIQGDYLFRDMGSFTFDGGLWGILRVGPAATPPPPLEPVEPGGCIIDRGTGQTTC